MRELNKSKDMTLTRLSFESFERNTQLLTTDDAIKLLLYSADTDQIMRKSLNTQNPKSESSRREIIQGSC